MTRDRLYRLAVCLHVRRRRSPEASRLRTALGMRDFGVAMYRQRMRRENPHATEAEITAMVWAWLQEPPQDRTLPPPPERRNDDDR